MSSHHIVREKQEPALLLVGLDNFSEELLGQLLEWSPTVIATPLVAEQLNTLEIKIDIIIADEIDLNLQSDIKQLPQGSDTQVEAAVNYLIKNDYKAVNVVANNVIVDDFLSFASQINIVIYSGNQKIYAVTSGFNKWKPAKEHIRILSVPLNLQTKGLSDNGNGNFITIADGFISLNFEGGFLFIAEEI